jgi:putative flippase GtrA
MSSRVVRFIIVGVINTLAAYVAFRSVLAALPTAIGAPAVAQAAAYAAGMACSFVLNRLWTFESRAARGPEAARFVVSQVALFAVSAAAVETAVTGFGVRASAAWVTITGLVAVLNYFAQRDWVFRVRAPA